MRQLLVLVFSLGRDLGNNRAYPEETSALRNAVLFLIYSLKLLALIVWSSSVIVVDGKSCKNLLGALSEHHV